MYYSAVGTVLSGLLSNYPSPVATEFSVGGNYVAQARRFETGNTFDIHNTVSRNSDNGPSRRAASRPKRGRSNRRGGSTIRRDHYVIARD